MNTKYIWVIVAVLILAVLLSGCGPSDEQCDLALTQMVDYPGEKLDAMQVNMILNNNWPPDSVGEMLQECINSGWDGYR